MRRRRRYSVVRDLVRVVRSRGGVHRFEPPRFTISAAELETSPPDLYAVLLHEMRKGVERRA